VGSDGWFGSWLGRGGSGSCSSLALSYLLLTGSFAMAFDGLIYLTGSTCVGHLSSFGHTLIFSPWFPFWETVMHNVRGRRRISYLSLLPSVDRFLVDVPAINVVVFCPYQHQM
jgi:hypothetical protein